MYIKRFLGYLKSPVNIYITGYPVPILQGKKRYYYGVPFINLYERLMGHTIPEVLLRRLEKEGSKINNLTEKDLKITLQILNKFGISAEEAFTDPHVFCMNPIAMDNYGMILQECNFAFIQPKHIIRYHTLVKSRTIKQLKQEGLLKENLKLEELLYSYFHDWLQEDRAYENYDDSQTNILSIRMIVLEKFLKWKLHITSEEFQKYCKNYLPLRHRPMSDIIESLDIAQNNIQFSTETIRRNGCLVAADPVNTKLMLDKVDSLGGLDIREAIRIEPSILKNNYQSLLQIRSLLEQYNISDEAQRRCLKVYCMNPKTVQERLDELVNLKEFQVLASNPRVLYMVVHKRKMLNRITKIQAAKKQCYSLNHLVSSNKIFNTYINSFGNKICSRDVAVLICSSLHCPHLTNKSVLDKLRRHKYWLHTALHVVNENLLLLKKSFSDLVIYNNCQIVLYPVNEIQHYIDLLLRFRENGKIPKHSRIEDSSFNNLECAKLTDDQILSLVLYEIEKKHHFSGDGIWNKLDGGKIGSTMNHRLKQNYAS